MGSSFRTALIVAAAGLFLAAPLSLATPASAEAISTMKLMAPGPLPEQALGKPTAPVTIVEYASLTCPHCANFYNTVFGTLKTKYIDTGKVYFVLREFPLDQLALAAVVAARCAPADQYFPIIDTLFSEQKEWAFVEKPGLALLDKLGKYGFDEASFDQCMARKDLIQSVVTVAQRGQDEFGVDGTPAFFINGEKHSGELDVAKLDAILQPLVDKP